MYKLFFFTLLILFWAGCGGNGGSNIQASDEDIVLDRSAKRQFGYLADATVNLYALDDGGKTLLFSETTSSGQTLEEIGNFDPHMRDMQREVQYLYEVSGGENWDVDKDGIKDTTPTPNTKRYRAIYQGYRQKVAWWSVKTGGNDMAPSE